MLNVIHFDFSYEVNGVSFHIREYSDEVFVIHGIASRQPFYIRPEVRDMVSVKKGKGGFVPLLRRRM